MSYTTLEIELHFDKVWELYPNKAKESSARKAYAFKLKDGENHEEIEQAVRIYALETRGDEYHYHFSNFLHEDHWRDLLDAHKNVEAYIQSLEQREEEAKEIIREWNRIKRPHWCSVLKPESKLGIVTKALQDPEFKQYWRTALEKASYVFRFPFRENDWRRNLVLSIRWFCNTHADKHTVLRILEGEFGREQRDEEKRKKPETRQLTKEEQQEVIQLMKEVFDDDSNDEDDDGPFTLS